MRFILAIAILALATFANAAEGRHTAFVGGAVAGFIGGFLAHDAMEAKPAPQVVYVESQPRTVIVEEAPRIVYVERQPRVVYVVEEAPRRVVYVERHENRGHEWHPALVRPFPQ